MADKPHEPKTPTSTQENRSQNVRASGANNLGSNRGERPSGTNPASSFIVNQDEKVTALGTITHGLKLLFKGCVRYPKISIITFTGAVVFGLAQVTAAAVLGWATTNAMGASYSAGTPLWPAIFGAVAMVMGLALVRLLGLIGRRVGSGFLGFELFAESRNKLAHKYTNLPIEWHRRQNTGRLMAHVTSDVDAAWRVIFPFPFAVATVFMLIYAFWSIFRADMFLGIVGVVMFPLIISVNVVYLNKLMPLVRAAQALRSDVTRTAHESFEAASVVKVLGREKYEGQRFENSANRLRDASIRLDFVRAFFDPFLDSLPYVGVLLVLLIGGWRVESGAMPTSTLVQVAYIFMIIGLPIRSFGWVLADLPRAVVGDARLNTVFNAQSDQGFGRGNAQGSGPARVDVRQVGFGFKDAPEAIDAADSAVAAQEPHKSPGPTAGEPDGTNIVDGDANTQVLTDLDLHISSEPGHNIVAVVGATGSGKSTLTQLVARLIDPQMGRIELDQMALDSFAAGEVGKDVALVLQNAFIFDDTVRNNLQLGERLDEAQLWAALEVAQAGDFVRQLPEGIDTELGERGGSLSGGQRQRLALARALVRQPRLLILDDATSAVDPAVEAAILASLREAVTGMSLLMVAYRKATIALADEVVFMEGGSIVARGTHHELLNNPAYAALVNAYDEAAIARNLLESQKDELAREKDIAEFRLQTETGLIKVVPESLDATEPFMEEYHEVDAVDEPDGHDEWYQQSQHGQRTEHGA